MQNFSVPRDSKLSSGLQEMEDDDKREANPHKECASSFVTKFVNDFKIVRVKFTSNPFLVTQLLKVEHNIIFPRVYCGRYGKVFSLGKSQYEEFKLTRFLHGSADVIKITIPNNSLKLPSSVSRSRSGLSGHFS